MRSKLSAQAPRPDAGQFWRTPPGCLGAARGSWDLKANDQGPDIKPRPVARSPAGWLESARRPPRIQAQWEEGSRAQGPSCFLF